MYARLRFRQRTLVVFLWWIQASCCKDVPALDLSVVLKVESLAQVLAFAHHRRVFGFNMLKRGFWK